MLLLWMKLYLRVRLWSLRLRGHDISVGKNCLIHPSVSFWLNGGKIVIGDNCHIMKGSIFDTHGGDIVLGNHVSINPYCMIYGHGGLVIGDHVRIANHCTIVPSEHIYERRDIPIRKQGLSLKGIQIKEDVWIGSGARILDGSVIGEHSIIAAGAVMKGTTAPYEIWGGIPARKIKDRP